MNTGKLEANSHWKEDAVLYEFGPEIGLAGIAVYDVLTMFAQSSGSDSGRVAYPSISRIAGILGCSAPTVRSALKKLEDAGLIQVQQRSEDGGSLSHCYTLLNVQNAVVNKRY